MTNIFIANLDWEITSEDLKATFSAFGTVSYAHVVYDRETKKSKATVMLKWMMLMKQSPQFKPLKDWK